MSETGVEYLSSFAYAAFPFAEDAPGLIRTGDPVYGPVSTLPIDIFVDAVITTDNFTDNIYLSEINNTGTGDLNINLRDSDGGLIMTIFAPLFFPASQSRYALIAADVNGRVARLVVRRDRYLEYVAGLTIGVEIGFGQRLPLSASAFDFRPQKVSTFELIEELPPDGTPVTAGPIDGDVRFDAGYNVALDITASAENDTTDITIEAEAGAGEGVVPCDDDSYDQAESFMGLSPDSAGNVGLAAADDNCHAIVHQGEIIQLTGTCEACCSCDDYVAVSQYLKDLLDRAAALYQSLEDTKAVYTAGVELYNETIADNYNGVQIRISPATPGKNVYRDSGGRNRTRIMGSIYNASPDPVEPVSVLWDFSDELKNMMKIQNMQIAANNPLIGERGTWNVLGASGKFLFDLEPYIELLPLGDSFTFSMSAFVPYPINPVWKGTITFTYRIKDDTVEQTIEKEFEFV